MCVYYRKISRVRAERLCLFPCVSLRLFPYDFTTKAWCAPDGRRSPCPVFITASEEPSVSAAAQTHAGSTDTEAEVLPGTQGHQLLHSIIPLTSQTLHKTDPQPETPQVRLCPCSRWSRTVTWAARTVLRSVLEPPEAPQTQRCGPAHNSDRTHPSHDVTVAILAQWWSLDRRDTVSHFTAGRERPSASVCGII